MANTQKVSRWVARDSLHRRLGVSVDRPSLIKQLDPPLLVEAYSLIDVIIIPGVDVQLAILQAPQ
jgi:hypothetical protein